MLGTIRDATREGEKLNLNLIYCTHLTKVSFCLSISSYLLIYDMLK